MRGGEVAGKFSHPSKMPGSPRARGEVVSDNSLTETNNRFSTCAGEM